MMTRAKYHYWIFSIFILLVACNNAPYKPYWPEEKLVAVVADLRIIDSQVKKHLFNEKDSVRKQFKELLFKIHDIREEDLVHHLKYIQSDPNKARALEEKVHELLKGKADEFES